MAIEKLGRYEITAELGQGAMGVVYQAADPLLDRTVAIKTINLDLSRDELEDFERRFYREAKSAGRLNHPNIVTIYDVGKADNVAYMAMEFLQGEELRDVLDASGPLPIDKIADIATQVAEGLAFAHEHGVVHRDIKPTNIMILRNGLAKITDFGIALMPSASRTMVGMVLGSPKYMSPEQVVGQEVDGRSDIFSLGVVLYEMLAGVPPFTGENISAIMYRILNEMPLAPKTINPDIPEAFNYIVAKALAKHPGDRYQTAREMAHDLRNYKALEVPDSIYPSGPAGKLRTLERRARPRPIEEETAVLSSGSASPTLIDMLETCEEDDRPQNVAAASPALPQPSKKRIAIMAVAAAAGIFLAASLLLRNKGDTPAPEAGKPAVAAGSPTSAAKTASAEPAAKIASLPPVTEASLVFAITPWGEIFVDGKSHGVSPPLKDLKIPAGKHTIEVRNASFAPYSETLDIKPATTKKIKHKFK
jgi:serine/threonine-protein kinase